jgi:uncharacterized protein YcbK (DUF882 family)
MKGKQLTPHFNEDEFRCKDGSLDKLDIRLPQTLEKLRALAGSKSIHINSGYRSPAYNKKIGGSTNSQHMQGTAADITIAGLTPKQVAALAEKAGFMGVGTYPTFTHVDVRPKKARWNG